MISVSVFAILGFTVKLHISFYVGLIEACMGVGDSFGPLLSEYITSEYSYRTQFLIYILILSFVGMITHFLLDQRMVDQQSSNMLQV